MHTEARTQPLRLYQAVVRWPWCVASGVVSGCRRCCSVGRKVAPAQATGQASDPVALVTARAQREASGRAVSLLRSGGSLRSDPRPPRCDGLNVTGRHASTRSRHRNGLQEPWTTSMGRRVRGRRRKKHAYSSLLPLPGPLRRASQEGSKRLELGCSSNHERSTGQRTARRRVPSPAVAGRRSGQVAHSG